MTASEITMAIIAGLNLVMVFIAWRRTSRQDTSACAAMDEQARTDMRYLMRGVDDIRIDIRALRNEITDIDRRVVAVSESVKSAHKRLDEHLQQEHQHHT